MSMNDLKEPTRIEAQHGLDALDRLSKDADHLDPVRMNLAMAATAALNEVISLRGRVEALEAAASRDT